MCLTISFLPQILAITSVSADDPAGSQTLAGLAGTWKGMRAGEPCEGSVEKTCAWLLRGKFLQCTGRVTCAPTETTPQGEVHALKVHSAARLT